MRFSIAIKGKEKGFTLAELLIALAILGVIATFTIPKILDSGSNSKFNAIAKEAASSMSQAYEMHKLQNGVTSGLKIHMLAPYLNYVRSNTTDVDSRYGGGLMDCSIGNHPCYLLHNGAVIWSDADYLFGSTDNTAGLPFYVDPDGVYSGSTTGPGKSIVFWLYPNGRLTTYGTMQPNTSFNRTSSTIIYATPFPSYDPPWFSWSD